jgi:hypothetical protein
MALAGRRDEVQGAAEKAAPKKKAKKASKGVAKKKAPGKKKK